MWLAVRYVDGQETTVPPADWPRLRGDGVDYVDLLVDDRGYRMQGQSVVWVYREAGLWVLGGGTVRDVREVVATPSGVFEPRNPEHMPDLTSPELKSGWWDRCDTCSLDNEPRPGCLHIARPAVGSVSKVLDSLDGCRP